MTTTIPIHFIKVQAWQALAVYHDNRPVYLHRPKPHQPTKPILKSAGMDFPKAHHYFVEWR